MITPSQRLRGVLAGVLVLSLVVLGGCGGGKGNKNTMLTGSVSYKGKPVTGGTLTLTSADSQSVPVNTHINPDGTYSIVPPGVGEMKVAIETESIHGQTGVAYPGAPKGAQMPQVDTSKLPKYVEIPRKYADAKTSGLTVTIQKGKNEKKFELAD